MQEHNTGEARPPQKGSRRAWGRQEEERLTHTTHIAAHASGHKKWKRRGGNALDRTELGEKEEGEGERGHPHTAGRASDPQTKAKVRPTETVTKTRNGG